MKKLLLAFFLLISYVTTFAQTPQIGHFQTLATVRRGDTLDQDYISQQFSKEANREYAKTYYTDTQNFLPLVNAIPTEFTFDGVDGNGDTKVSLFPIPDGVYSIKFALPKERQRIGPSRQSESMNP